MRQAESLQTVIVRISVAASSVGSDLHRSRWKSDTPPGLRIQPEPSSAAQHNPVRRINPERSSQSLETDLNSNCWLVPPTPCLSDCVGQHGGGALSRHKEKKCVGDHPICLTLAEPSASPRRFFVPGLVFRGKTQQDSRLDFLPPFKKT